MARTKRLGKGLGALLTSTDPDADQDSPSDQAVQDVPVTAIEPNPHQPRTMFDQDRLAELAESIGQHGLVQPVVVRQSESGYELVAGERRWRASQMAGIDAIPAIVRDVDEAQMLEIALIENLQREDLNPIEQARAFETLLDGFGLTQAELADRVGKSRSQVSNTLRLLNLTEEVRDLVADGRLSMGHARLLVPLGTGAQLAIATRMIEGGWSVRESERQVKAIREGEDTSGRGSSEETQEDEGARSDPTSSREDPQLKALQEQMADHLGTPVKIQVDEDGAGQMMIRFYDRDGLVDLFDRLRSLADGF